MSKPQTFSITTLGCKVNQFESLAIARELEGAGLIPGRPHEPAQVCIINTCAVTAKAAMQSRQAVRQALRHHPDARVVVTGCYAQTAPEELYAISGVTAVVEQRRKRCVADIALGRPCRGEPPAGREGRALEFLPADGGERGRPYLKIQDGCESFCTYCIVPYARGPSRSLPVAAVLESLRQLHDRGYAEAVLTGIHLGIYGRDLHPAADLAGLLARIGRERSIRRVRLSSIEPAELSDEILGQVADADRPYGRICPHFHVPLQSGDSGILRRMGRPYTPQFFGRLLETLRRRFPEAALGSDVLVGFPGETEAAFHNTLQCLQAAPLTYLHVFPFSPRPGTPAAGFPDRVPPAVIKERCRRLRAVGYEKKREFYLRFLHKTLEVVLETQVGETDWLGTSENYIPVRLRIEGGRPGKAVAARIIEVSPDLAVRGAAAARS